MEKKIYKDKNYLSTNIADEEAMLIIFLLFSSCTDSHVFDENENDHARATSTRNMVVRREF